MKPEREERVEVKRREEKRREEKRREEKRREEKRGAPKPEGRCDLDEVKGSGDGVTTSNWRGRPGDQLRLQAPPLPI